jgi:membrane protease YdiL (CAAX protease family)
MAGTDRPQLSVDSIAALVFAMVFPAVATWGYFIQAAFYSERIQQITLAAGKLLQFAFPVVWVLLIRRERVVWKHPMSDGVGAGAAFGAVVFAAMLLVYHLGLRPSGFLEPARGAIAEKVLKFGIRGPGAFAAMGVFYAGFHSFLEEYYWRWFVFGQLRRLIPWTTAALVSSLAFMAHHVLVLACYFGWTSWATWLFSLSVAVGGVVWCWIYQRSGSLVGPWLSHLLIDAAIFTIGYDIVHG